MAGTWMIALLSAFLIQRASCIAPLHQQSEDKIPGHYIVVLKDDVDVDSFTSAFEASVLRGASEGQIRYKYRHAIKGFSAKLSEETLNKLRYSKHVKYVEEDGIVTATAVSSWGLDRVDQRSRPLDNKTPLFNGDGYGTHLYIIDTGTLKSHNEFSGRYDAHGFDAIGSDIGADCNGHGTHCGGTAGGTTYGVANKASIHSVRVLGCSGSGTNSGVIRGMDFVASNAKKPAVASMSLGGGKSTSVNNAVSRMHNAGIVVSVAAGNDNTNACNKSPASAPQAITVAATDSSDKRAWFSNKGSCVDIFAPGVSIKSAWIGSNSATKTISGTSMATPHVSGAAAIAFGRNKGLTAQQVIDQLIAASTPNKVSDVAGSPNKLLYAGKSLLNGYSCEHGGNGVHMECGAGQTISVTSALYGRRTASICGNDNTKCAASSALSVAQQRCNGKRTCDLSASNSIFGDPCHGVEKYLDVQYTCDGTAPKTACEHQGNLDVSCSSGTITIASAFYGRVTSSVCNGNIFHMDCSASTALDVVRQKCNGKSSCSVAPSNSLFGDPCPTTNKYLQVQFTCA